MNLYDDDILDLDKDDSKSDKRKRTPVKKKNVKTRNPLTFVTILLSIISLLSLSLSVLLILKFPEVSNEPEKIPEQVAVNEPSESTYTQEQVDNMLDRNTEEVKVATTNEVLNKIKELTSENTALWPLLRELYPDNVVVYTSQGFQFFPISDTLEKTTVKGSDMVLQDNGIIKYSVNGIEKGHMGIDVSSYQGNIDWEQVAEFGVEYAYIRACYRGYGSGKLVEDENCSKNIRGAMDNGIKPGVYCFSQAITEEEIIEEAQMLIDSIKPYTNDAPIIIDVEKTEDNTGRGNQLSQGERTRLVEIFCNEIRAAGYTPVIYGNLNSLFIMLDIEKIADEKIWFANFGEAPYYPYKMHAWQYSESLTIPGISNKVDADIIFEP